MSNEINNGGTCPFCFNKVHPQAVACSGCGASYRQEPSKIQILVTLLVILFIMFSPFVIGETGAFVLFLGFVGWLIYMKPRWKYVWVRRQP